MIAAIMPSISGCSSDASSFTRSFPYTAFVDTEICGFAITRWHCGGAGSSVRISPIPSDRAVPRMIQYGTSAPSFTPRSISSFFVNPRSNIRFTPTKTAAASVLPPAMPAATGIYLRIFMVTPSLIPFSSRSSFAARHARFPSPSGTNGRFVSVLITPSSVRSISIRSYRFTVCMIMRTSWYPSSLFRTTSRPRLILAYALRSKWSFMLSPSIFSTRESYHRNASHSQEQI